MEKEIHSEQISAGKRTYFLYLKETLKGDKYLVLTESKKKDDATFDRHSVMNLMMTSKNLLLFL